MVGKRWHSMINTIPPQPVKKEVCVDSRIIAEHLGNQHEAAFELISAYQGDLEEFGVIRFKIGKPAKGTRGARPERYALLNEDQPYLSLTYSKNTLRARRLKINLVKAFSRFRQHQQTEVDYLPFYHALHDEVRWWRHQAESDMPNPPALISALILELARIVKLSRTAVGEAHRNQLSDQGAQLVVIDAAIQGVTDSLERLKGEKQ
jgi:phage regulator Rha-like protein